MAQAKKTNTAATAVEEAPPPPVPARVREHMAKVLEMPAPADYDLSQLHDELLAAGVEPRQVEDVPERTRIRLTFESEEERDRHRAVCEEKCRRHVRRSRVAPLGKAELLAAVKDARPGTAEFKTAVLAALDRLL